MSLITVCACLTQPVGQAAFGLLYGRFAALPSAVLFAAAAALDFYKPCCIAHFTKKPFLLQNHERFFTNLLKSSY